MWDARQLPECLICPCFMFQLWSHSAPGLVYLCTQTLFYPLSSTASQWHLLLVFQQLEFGVCEADGALMYVFFFSVPIWFLSTPNLANPKYPRNGIWVFWRCTKESRQAWTYKVITERVRSCLESISSFGIHLMMANFSCPKSSPKTWFISVEVSRHWPSPARLLQTLNGRF